MPATHYLKTEPAFFDAVKCGAKTFEIRRNDRGYQTGDTLILLKYVCTSSSAVGYMDDTGNLVGLLNDSRAARLDCRVTYILSGGQFGLNSDYVVMSIELEAKAELSHEVERRK